MFSRARLPPLGFGKKAAGTCLLAFLTLVPWISYFLREGRRAHCLAVYEAVVLALGLGRLAWHLWPGRRPPGHGLMTQLYVALTLLSFSSTIFNLRVTGWAWDLLAVLADASDVLSFSLLLVVILRGCAAWDRPWAARLAEGSLLAVTAYSLTHQAILPVWQAEQGWGLRFLVSFTLSWVAGAWLFVAAFMGAFRTLNWSATLLMQSTVLLLLAALAGASDIATGGLTGVDWAEPFWAFAIGGLWSAVYIEVDPASWRALAAAPWRSFRAGLGLLVCLQAAAALLTARWLGMLPLRNGADLAATVLVVWVAWTGANLLALLATQKLRAVRATMPMAVTTLPHESQGMLAHLPFITATTGLAETDAIIDGYNDRVAQVNELAAAIGEQAKKTALGEAAAQVAHDIRSPLAALRVALANMTANPAAASQLARESSDRIAAIASQLLTVRRGTLEPIESADELFLLTHVLQDCMAQARLHERNLEQIEIELNQQPRVSGRFLHGSRVHFTSVIINLLTNAIESIGEAGKVSLSADCCDDIIEVAIRDTGKGMERKILTRLGRTTITSGKVEGNGLGVRHAYQTVQKMGGTLQFSSVLGEGTTALLRLPLAEPDRPSSTTHHLSAPPLTSVGSTSSA